jgi:shikimate 5-dehydrogenase
LLTRKQPRGLPQHMVFVDRELDRLERLRSLIERLPGADIEYGFACTQSAEENDALLGRLPPGSLAVNATGLGKDRPGSPLTDAAVFPQDGIAWDLNYRGRLDFLQQARLQAGSRRLKVADGWDLFVIGWALVMQAVFAVDPFGPVYAELEEAAEAAR